MSLFRRDPEPELTHECVLPSTTPFAEGEEITCPTCGTTYRRSERVPQTWRQGPAPYGVWKPVRSS